MFPLQRTLLEKISYTAADTAKTVSQSYPLFKKKDGQQSRPPIIKHLSKNTRTRSAN